MALRKRVLAAGTGLVLVLAGVACTADRSRNGDGGGPQVGSAMASRPDDDAPRPTTTVRSTPPTTVRRAPSVPASSSGVLRRGSRSVEVETLQRQLKAAHYDPGPADGAYGTSTVLAVEAFQALNGIGQSGVWGPSEKAAMLRGRAPIAQMPDGGANRLEIDLRKQTLVLYRDGQVVLASHVSTGSGKRYCVEGECKMAITPAGAHRFAWRRSGWWESRLGKLYNPVYFTSSGIAVHGSLSVPAYPASHGCVRIPMHIAEYFPSLVKRGDAVYVLDGKTKVGPLPPLSTGPPPTAKPVKPATTTTSTTAPAPTTTTSTTAVPTTTTSSTIP